MKTYHLVNIQYISVGSVNDKQSSLALVCPIIQDDLAVVAIDLF